MKKIILLIPVFIIFITNSCSSGDDSPTEQPTPINKTIPSELIGTWKITYVAEVSDPYNNLGNSFGAFIKFNTDNSVECKDGNYGTFKLSPNQVNGSLSNMLTLNFNNLPDNIQIRKTTVNGEYEFTTRYSNKNPNYRDMILRGTKQ